MKLELTSDHPASRYHQPVFLVAGEWVANSEGVKALREKKGWSTQQMSEEMGVSKRTVEGWESGRPVPPMALKLMETFL